jgi:hypothetical protein
VTGPVTWPLDPKVWLGVWATGEADDGQATMCGWIAAKDHHALREIVEEAWPEFAAQDWRITPRPHPEPPGNRFPLPSREAP